MNDLPEKKMPFSATAEQSLLGAILIDPDAITRVTGKIKEDDFYISEHKRIFSTMRRMFEESRDIDPVTLVNKMVADGVYDESGGEEYIRTLGEVVPGSQNIEDYLRIIKDKSTLRQLISACGEISALAFSEQGKVSALVEAAENKIYDITKDRYHQGFRRISEVVKDVYAELEKLSSHDPSVIRTDTGFSSVDNILCGMGKGDLVLVGARPGHGKTSFAMNIASNVAKATKKTVCIFSLEMSAEQLVSRLLSSEAKIDSRSLRTGELKDDDWRKLAEASALLFGLDIKIDDSTAVTASAMKAKLLREKNLGLVVVDYLQLMQGEKYTDNKVQEVADITRNLKLMAKELCVPVICCSQLNRSIDTRADRRPKLSDLRDSGSIEQDADVVIFLYNQNLDKGNTQETAGSVIDVVIAKNRHGSTGDFKLGWVGQYTLFRTLASEESLPDDPHGS